MRYEPVPALIITGYAEEDAISDRPEGVEILLKPFTPKQLATAIERAVTAERDCTRREQSDEATTPAQS